MTLRNSSDRLHGIRSANFGKVCPGVASRPSWLSISVELVEGHGRSVWPRSGMFRLDIVNPTRENAEVAFVQFQAMPIP